jgi:hypothetical protein
MMIQDACDRLAVVLLRMRLEPGFPNRPHNAAAMFAFRSVRTTMLHVFLALGLPRLYKLHMRCVRGCIL